MPGMEGSSFLLLLPSQRGLNQAEDCTHAENRKEQKEFKAQQEQQQKQQDEDESPENTAPPVPALSPPTKRVQLLRESPNFPTWSYPSSIMFRKRC
jgi:hypothetical protein